MEPKILYNLGTSVVTGPSVFSMLILGIVTVACVWAYRQQRRAGTAKPETRVILLGVAVLTGGTALILLFSALPDAINPPIVERGRVMRLYYQPTGSEGSRIDHVVLSNGTDMVVDDLLAEKLTPGICVEMTRTPATKYVLIARMLAPDDCLKGS